MKISSNLQKVSEGLYLPLQDLTGRNEYNHTERLRLDFVEFQTQSGLYSGERIINLVMPLSE